MSTGRASSSGLKVVCRCGEQCEELCIGSIAHPRRTIYRCTKLRAHTSRVTGQHFPPKGCGAEYAVESR